MPSNVDIRRFRASDAESLIVLWAESLPSTQPWNDPGEVLRRKLNRNDDLVLIAEQDGAVIGAAVAGYDGIRGWIYRLAVLPQCRRRGIGRGLLDEAEAALLALGCPKVNLQVRSTNSQVLDFYRRCGYEVEDLTSFGKRLADESGFPAERIPSR